jgi:amino acid adenylation domain-containing protein
LACYLPDGNIEFLGRIDDQVKIRGYRIELGEIETVLGQHPGLSEIVVLARDEPAGTKRLVAYVVRKQNLGPTSAELRSFLRAKLQEYMVPSAFVFLDSLPVSSNGKVDRNQLPEPDQNRLNMEESYVAPSTPVEELLAGIWSELLKIEKLGVHDNFFDLGGHSLLATQVISRIRTTFRIDLPLRRLFEAPTVAGLAQAIQEVEASKGASDKVALLYQLVAKMSPGGSSETLGEKETKKVGYMKTSEFSGAVSTFSDEQLELLAYLLEEEGLQGDEELPLVPRTRKESPPLSFAQARLWFLDQLEPNSSLYNVPWAMRLRGPLAIAPLTQALNTLLARHEILRTTFNSVDGSPIQVISEPRPLELSVIDLRSWKEIERELEAVRLAEADARQPFDLIRGPLLRATLIRLGEEDHVMLLTMHHIVSDGWSTVVFERELSELYQALSKGLPPPLADLPIQYADFAVWQRNWLQGKVLDEQLSYWKKQLGNLPAVLNLPTDRPRPPVQSYRGARQTAEFSKDLTQRLKALSRKEGVTLFMTLLAAFQTLLHRYTGHDDVAVGSPIAGRNRKEIEGLIGFFVNTLVLRCNFSGDPTFNEVLIRAREMALGAYAHQDLPFEKLMEELKPERSLNHSPLFQVMFDLQNESTAALQIEGLTLSSFKMENGTAKFDLTLTMSETREGLRASLRYNTDLFEAATIKRLLGHFGTLLEGIVSNPQARIPELPILTDAEKHQLLIEWNDTKRDYRTENCVAELFETQAQRVPGAVALVFSDERITYAELNRRANQLAHYLQKLGVRPGTLVGICMEQSLEAVVALLGILKAGGAYVPFDPAYPEERLAFLLQDAQVPVLLSQESVLKGLPPHQAKAVCLDADWETIAAESEDNPVHTGSADHPAYVIYTSGSTGVPKGVVISHRGLYNRLTWGQEAYGLSEADRVLQAFSLSFDFASWEILTALVAGARLVIAEPGSRQDSRYIVRLMAEHKITLCGFVPSMLRAILDEPEIEACSSLKRVVAGGEALPVELQERFFARHGAELENTYGPTEASIDVTRWICRRADDFNQRQTVPIGRPIANTQLYILDSHLQPVPIGVSGELHIGGDCLARSYLNRPELTDEKFIPNPFSDEPGARLYKTGDLACYLPDGNIEFLGRIDDQVKIRGYRIELGEIESVLSQHPAVRETVVVVRDHAPNDKQLVAYVVPSEEPVPTACELRAFLQQKLPNYMIPSVFVCLESLPLTPNGKIDRRILPEPDGSKDLTSTFTEPRDEVERHLVRIWKEVLAVNHIGTRDNFFHLGGHSLSAVRMFTRLEEYLRIRIPLATLFQAPTIEGLAKVIRDSGRLQPSGLLVAIQPAGSRPPIFAVPGVGGNVLCYYDLAQLMAPEQPFYGLQSHGLSGTEKPLTSIEEIATAFLGEIREVQPEGPYYLIGACMGGVVAYEMAQQLRAAGQEVGLLTLLETWLPVKTPQLRHRFGVRTLAALNLIGNRLRLYFQALASLLGRQRFNYLLGRLKKLTQIVVQRDALLGNRSEFYMELATQANLLAFQRYAPRAYPGRGVLFCARGRRVAPHSDRRLAWRHLFEGGLEIYNVPGDDSGLILTEPQVRVLARQLKACIESAQQLETTVERA